MDTPNRNHSLVLWIIAGVLVLVLGTNAYMSVALYREGEARQRREELAAVRAEAAQELVQRQQSLVLDMMGDYQDAAYGPNVDRISEQQLIATEHQLLALQTLAIQNSQIIELLAAMP